MLFLCVVPLEVRCCMVLLFCFLIVAIYAVDVDTVKSYQNHLFDPACLPMRIRINKLYFVPKPVVSGDVSMF